MASLATAVALLLPFAERSDAGNFTVNTTADTHAVSPGTSPNDSGGNISLRSAIEAANAQAGPSTITLPAGTYTLSLGELSVAPNGSKTNTITGAGAATTIVNQADGTNRVFNIDFSSLGSTLVTFSGITIQGGRDGLDLLGGAGILAGSVTSINKDRLILNNCVVRDNHCLASTTQEPGGGIQMAGGDLILNSCTFSNNTSGQSFGGAVFVLAQSVISALNVTNSIFLNNSMTNNSGAGPNGGGGIMIWTPAGSTHNVIGCTFGGNRVAGNSGNTYGGAIQINGGSLNILNSTFVTNTTTGQGGLGGALYVDSGVVNLAFCRLVGNSASQGGAAVYNHGSNGATTVATNNWWGCNGGPGPGGCNVATGDGSSLNFSPWIVFTNTASPGTIGRGQSSTLTASILLNSSNQVLTPAQVPVLIGQPIAWSGVLHGNLTFAQNAIQANGLATATFTNDGTCNNGGATAALDNATAAATVFVPCPDLAVTKTNNVGGTASLPSTWTWTIHVANVGPLPATFNNGGAILLDNLPAAAVGYSPPSLLNVSGVTGSLQPALDGADNLTITANGAVTLNPGASFDVQVTATPSAVGVFNNPRDGGICAVDPGNTVVESNEGNNSASDSVTVTCPAITGTVTGGGTICPGNSAIVTVTISGGTPPYNVTLNNGGGTQIGNGPLLFSVSPASTTTYQIDSGTDSYGCSVANSGSATVTIGSAIAPTITMPSAGVFANSDGNQASSSGGYAGYAWTISNGFITSPANQPAITYRAGPSNTVTLALTVFNASGCSAGTSVTVPVTTGFSTHTNVTFTDALQATTIGLAFDGTNYWSCSGGSSSGVRFARYSATGVVVTTYSPGLDFRSVFTRPDGTVLARAYNTNLIYQQTSPGVFASSGVLLTGGTLDPQSAVALNGAGTEYSAMLGGVISRWSSNGTYLGSVTLSGFGSVSGENTWPQNRSLAVMDNFWLTWNGSGILSIWDGTGKRLLQATLPGAGTTFDSDFGFSFCNGKVFIPDVALGKWRGFDLYSSAAVAVLGAENTAGWNQDVARKIAGTGTIPRVDIIPVSSGNPVPGQAQLRKYQSVMIYSDWAFNDQNALGNVLADYVDQGGGVVVQTFAFATNTNYSLQGRLRTGSYLPFTSSGVGSAANSTLVKDLPLHPLLDGVASFNGGTTGFFNNPLSLAPGATLVGHWNNGQPLVGARDVGFGRCGGLNFFPPSSDVRSDLWVSSTDGGRMMANALLWSGRIPPVILSAPANQVGAIGATATFNVTAIGNGTLSYQWRLNGADIPSATNSTLSFTIQGASAGIYSVVVSNLFGATTSLGATLNPSLRFLPPAPAGNTFSLVLVDADGSPVASNRAPLVRIYGSTDPALPFSNWTLLTNPVVPNSGQLRVDGLKLNDPPVQFFRASEAP